MRPLFVVPNRPIGKLDSVFHAPEDNKALQDIQREKSSSPMLYRLVVQAGGENGSYGSTIACNKCTIPVLEGVRRRVLISMSCEEG